MIAGAGANITVQVVRRWYACAIGCERIGETGALAVVVSTIGAYAIGGGLSLSVATRLGIFVVSAIVIATLTRMRLSPGPAVAIEGAAVPTSTTVASGGPLPATCRQLRVPTCCSWSSL